MDGKLVMGLFADVLYIKGAICFEEFEAIQEARNAEDIAQVVEKMLRGEYNVYKKGETYAYEFGN